MIKRKFQIWIALFVMMIFLSSGVAQGSIINVRLNGQPLFFNVPPVVQEGCALVPLRPIFEALGAKVYWDEATKSVTAIRGQTRLRLQVGSRKAYKNGTLVTLEQAPLVIKGFTLVPLRFVSEAFGASVNWNPSVNTIEITTYVEPAGNVPTHSELKSNERMMDTVRVAEQERCVVTIRCSNGTTISQASGIIVDPAGLILTNYHVIESCVEGYVVTADGRSYKIDGVTGYNPDVDLAVLKITASGLPSAIIGDSDELLLGEPIMAIGSPKGLQNTISTGIVSGIRTIDGRKYIQITAPITHGSSGGGLFNRDGKLVGITTAGLGEADLNFAIPVNEALPFIKKTSLTPLAIAGSPAELSIQLIEALTCEAVDEENAEAIKPSVVFSPYAGRIYGFFRLNSSTTTEVAVTGNWYYVRNGTRELVSSSVCNLRVGDDTFWFWLNRGSEPFEAGQWELEVVSNRISKKLTFFVLNGQTTSDTASINFIRAHIVKHVIDGAYPNAFNLKPTEAIMFMEIADKNAASLFSRLSDWGKKKLMYDFVIENWGDVLGVQHCYTLVRYNGETLVMADINYDMKPEDIILVVP